MLFISLSPNFNMISPPLRPAFSAGPPGLTPDSLNPSEVFDISGTGQDTYSGAFSKPTCAELGQAAGCTVPSDSTSYSLADFMFGLPNQINLGSYAVINLRQYVHSLYLD